MLFLSDLICALGPLNLELGLELGDPEVTTYYVCMVQIQPERSDHSDPAFLFVIFLFVIFLYRVCLFVLL